MRQLTLPFYQPCFSASERAVLTLLHAALSVTEQSLRHEHPHIEHAPKLTERIQLLDNYAPIVVTTARLIVDRCAELRGLLDFYDAAVDDAVPPGDDSIPF